MMEGGVVDLDWLCSVVARNTPAFFLHPADAYMPCSVEFFMAHSELRVAEAGGRGKAATAASRVLLPRGSVEPGVLLEAQQRQPPGSYLWLHLDPAARTGMHKDQLDDVPVYVHPKWVLAADGCTAEALEIQYITLYAHNGHYNVGGLRLLRTGAHDGDVERITARVHPTSGRLLGMWYNSHRSRDGCWVAGPQVPRDPVSGRHAAYVARHGHGMYPQPGRVLRHFLLGNDLCSGAGPVWRPRRVVLLPHLGHVGIMAVAAGNDGRSGSVPPPRRHVLQVPSRGSQLCPQAHAVGTTSGDGGSDGGSGGAVAEGSAAGGVLDVPTVVTDDGCEWLRFSGHWGTIPFMQHWWRCAECPVSRSPLLRVVGHFVPERQRL